MSEDPKVVFSEKAVSDVSPDILAKIAVDIQTGLTTGGIEGLIAASSDVHFIEDADAPCLVCGGPLGPDRDMPAHPGALRCYATPACAKQSYTVASSDLGRALLESFDALEDDEDSDDDGATSHYRRRYLLALDDEQVREEDT
jgi:hypothetical protein